MARGFIYLVAEMSWYSRRVLSWWLSDTMTVDFCVEALQVALGRFRRPEIFNNGPNSQFTSERLTDMLNAASVAISMEGEGRWMDNVFIEQLWRTIKYEEI